MDQIHIPVMLDRIVDLLRPGCAPEFSSHPIVVDGTLGLGGHSEAILDNIPNVSVIGLDRDSQAIAKAQKRLEKFGDRFVALHTEYHKVQEALAEADNALCERALAEGINGALYDLGVSSMQLDEDERGFSYSRNAPLDMRMDTTQGQTAADVLNTYSVQELASVLRTYGDEKFANKIARAVVSERENQPFSESQELVDLLYRVIPAAARRTGGHPAKRTFQALRVEVNQELESLKAALPAVIELLAVGGRAVFMSYQSQEDKIVKRVFADYCASHTPLDLPVELPDDKPEFRLVRRGAEKATAEERAQNPRSASVRVRAIERLERTAA
ncbi:MAG: 16S rRNA (cytosine(1402)-N(4))-methyltransferase RsmH [Lawsonella sp.]